MSRLTVEGQDHPHKAHTGKSAHCNENAHSAIIILLTTWNVDVECGC